jgi:RNA polymerase sigma-70 factor (ECF subfamily)
MADSDDGAAAFDAETVEQLLVEHLPGLRAFVRLRAGPVLRSREAESDVVQSACREVLERAEGFRHGGSIGFRRWLYTTALRKILNKHEFHTAAKRDVRRDAPAEDSLLLSTYGNFCSPSGVAAAREELQRIEHAFEQLSPDHREVILLSRIAELSRAEVAGEMGRTEASVRNLLHRALAHLAQLLES